jgi:ubiquinone/menaquinone biosynthesis C-methylase UbiE
MTWKTLHSSNEQNYYSEFWRKRSEQYNKLEWANHQSFLDAFVQAGDFKETDIVLDVGTGTGIVAHAISPLVKQVIGLDKSQDMLEHSNWYDNMYFIKRDILDPIFKEDVFDKVTTRQVFHHILDGTQEAMDECYRVLKKGGKMIFSDGVPPSEAVKEDYMAIFKLKEERLTFMDGDLIALMERAGFRDIQISVLWLRQMSIKNWLINSGLPQSTQDEIFKLHVNAGDYFKEAYNLTENGGDCFIDMKMLILVGEK